MYMSAYPFIGQFSLQTGDVLVYSKKAIISRLIQIVTRSKFNHIGTVVRENNTIWVYEAIAKSYVRRLLRDSIEKDCLQVIVKRPNFSFDAFSMITEHDLLLGTKYDTPSIFFSLLHSLFGGWLGSRNVKRVYCSEAAAYVFNELTGLFPDWFKTSPDEFAENEVLFLPAKELHLTSII